LKVKSYWKAVLAVLLLISAWGCKETPPEQIEFDSIAYTGVNIINGEGGNAQMDMTIIVKNGMISQLGSREELNVPKTAEVIDMKGKWVIPGLIDMHAHVTVLPIDSNLAIIEEYDQEASFEALKTLLAFGITTVRNPAAPTNDALELRDLVKRNEVSGPTIYTTGFALNRTKAFFGPFAATSTEEEIRAEVQSQVEAGVDFIKVYGSLKPEQIRIAIDEAHKHDKKVIGHLQNTSWTEASDLGIDFVTHAAPWNGDYLPKELQQNYRPTFLGRLFWLENVDYNEEPIQNMIRSMRKHNVSVDPTLIAFHTKFWGDSPTYTNSKHLILAPKLVTSIWNKTTFTSGWSLEDYARAKQQWPKLLALTKLMYDNDIMITAGSDFPNPWVIPGISLHQELQLLSEAGIPNEEVLRIATLNGAKALGIDDRTGTIIVGKEADLVFLDANPLDHIENTQKIVFVLKDGKRYNPGDLNQHLSRE